MDHHQIIWDLLNPNDSSSSDELDDEINEALFLATQYLSKGEISQPRRSRRYIDREGGGSSKRSKLNEAGFYSSSSNPNTPTSVSEPESVAFPPHEGASARPTGIKNAKKKGKQVAQSSSEPMQAHLEKVDRLAMLQANRDMQKQEAKRETLKEQKKIIDDYVRTQNDYVRTQKLQMLTQLLAFDELSPDQEMIKAELMGELFPNK